MCKDTPIRRRANGLEGMGEMKTYRKSPDLFQETERNKGQGRLEMHPPPRPKQARSPGGFPGELCQIFREHLFPMLNSLYRKS